MALQRLIKASQEWIQKILKKQNRWDLVMDWVSWSEAKFKCNFRDSVKCCEVISSAFPV